LKGKIDGNRGIMRIEAGKAAKMEQRIGKMIEPYQESADTSAREHAAVLMEVEGLDRDLRGFEHLGGLESVACIERVEKAGKELDGVLRVEGELQREYAAMVEEARVARG
jgi:hypothetical protein